MNYIKLEKGEIAVGVPLPFDVYDGDGLLLLRQHYTIETEWQLETLLKRGVYREQEDKVADENREIKNETAHSDVIVFSPFKKLQIAMLRLDNIFQFGENLVTIKEQILRLASDIQLLCKQHPDESIAIIHLSLDFPYNRSHPVHQAILCGLIAQHMEDIEIKWLIVAALMSNVGMNELQEVLQKQTTPLTEEQKELIKQHPVRSAQWLQDIGITDKKLLETVMQHHERYDGSGYPQGLMGEAILQEAMIIGLADSYAAMVSTHAFKKTLLANDSLLEFFQNKGALFEESLCLIFIKVISVYPPGICVELQNGEKAIVIKRANAGTVYPTVSSVMNAQGKLYPRPILRYCNESDFKILSVCSLDDSKIELDLDRLWHY